MVPVKFDKDGLPIPQKVSFDKEGLPVPVKKKEVSEPILQIGGKAGTSEAPSGFGDLKPAKIQPVKVEVPKQLREEEVKIPKQVAGAKVTDEGQTYVSNLVSSLNRGFYSNLIGNPLLALSTVIKQGTSAMTGGRAKEGPISDFLDKFADKYNKAIVELNPQDKEFQGSLSDQFGQALGQVGSLVFTSGVGVGGRGAAIAEQAIPKAVTAAAPKTIAGKIATKAAPAVEGVKKLAKEIATPASVSAGLTVGQSEFDRAKQKGASDEQAFEAFYKNAIVGSVLEKIPVMQFLNRFNKATSGGFINYLKTKGVAGITGGLEEAVTEVLQQVYANKTAQDIYNVNQNIFEGLTESGGIGFGVGFLLNAMGAQAKILRQQGREEDAQALENQEKEFRARTEGAPPAGEPPAPPAAAPVTEEAVVAPQVPQTEETLNRYLSTYRRQLAERRKELTEQGVEDVEADEQVQNIKSKIGSTQERMAKLGEVAPVKEEAVRAGEVAEAPKAAPQVPAPVVDFNKNSDKELEEKMASLEGDESKRQEYNAIEKEMEKRERASVFNVPLEKVPEAINVLIKKEKEMPYGYGTFIDMQDARETRQIAEKYLNAKNLTDSELREDFVSALRGNPTSWYADGLKLRESLKESTNRKIDTKKLIDQAIKVYTDAGYDFETARNTVALMLKPVFEGAVKEAAPQVPATPRIPKERAAQLREQIKVEEVGEEVAPQVPVTPAKAEVVSIDEKETIRQMKPFTDEMANIEREFENRGLKIDTDYDNEIIVTDRQGNILDPEEIPSDIANLAAAYERATMKLGEFDQVAREKALAESRKVEEVAGEEVKAPELPETPKEEISEDVELSNLLKKYDEGDIVTFNDLVDEIEALERLNLQDAVDEYRREQEEDYRLAGRGDMDAAERRFMQKVQDEFAVIEQEKIDEKNSKNFWAELMESGFSWGQYGGKSSDTYYIKNKEGKIVKEIKIGGNPSAAQREIYKWIDSQAGTKVLEAADRMSPPSEEEVRISKEINIKEDEIPRVKKASTKRSRKSKNIAKAIESEAADVESSGDAERAADVVATIEGAEKAILEDKPVDTRFEDKYGMSEIELAREYDSRQGKVDIFTIYESLSDKKIDRGAEVEFISSFLNALNSEGFKLKKPLELDFGVVVNTTSSPAKKLKKEGFDSLEKIVSKDDIRPIFQSVFFDKGNLVATDAHTLVVIKKKESDSDIIKNAKEKLIKSYSKTVGEKEATRFANEKYAPLEKSGLEGKLINQKTGEITDGKFPDYQAIIPQDFPLTQSLPIQDIIDLTNGAIEGLKSASKTRMAIMFNVTGDTEVKLGINPSFLLKTLQALQANGAKSIKMGFGGPTKAITIKADNGDMGLVMPLMINEDDLKINITDAKPLTVKKAKVGDAVRKLAEKAREGKINKPGTARASTGFDAVWDAALEVVATSLEAGASVADAIEAGLKYVKSTGWYKKVKNKEEFDQQFKDVLNQEYAVQVEAAGEIPVQPEAGVSEEVEAGVPGAEPKKPTEKGEGAPKKGERRFTKTMIESPLQDAVKKGVAATMEYTVQTNAMSIEQAQEVLNVLGEDKAYNALKDERTNGAVRVVIGQVLIKRYNELAKEAKTKEDRDLYIDATIDIAEYVTTKLATDAGQTIQAFKLWQQLTPEAQLAFAVKQKKKSARRNINKVRKDIDNLGEKFNKANEDAVKEILRSEEVDQSIKKDTQESISKAKDRAAKARQKRADIIKKYKGKGGITLTSGGLTKEGIEFVGEVALTYIEEGIAEVQVIAEKIFADIKSITGSSPNDETKAEILDIANKTLVKSDIETIKSVKDQKLKINEIAIKHFTEVEKVKKDLAQKFVDEADMSEENAEALAKRFEDAFDRVVSRKKAEILAKDKKRFDRIQKAVNEQAGKKAEKKTLQDEIIKYSNLGAFNSDEMLDFLSKKFDLGQLTTEQAAKIQELAEKIQKAPEGSPKREATEDLLAYQANLNGGNWGEVAQGIWYANILSGYRTHEKNIVSTFFNSLAELGTEVIADPKGAPYLIAGYARGLGKIGMLEGLRTLKTGRSPIHVRAVEIPDILERKKFIGGGYNPANWFKYVGRAMKAEDILSFQGLKEARAWQLARKEAEKYGFNTWSRSGWKKVNELLLNTAERYEIAKEQAESEGLKPDTKDWKRRIYELMENSRPEAMTEDAYNFAAHGTYNYNSDGTLGAVTNAVSKVLDIKIGNVQPGRFVVPFTRIITNVVNNALDYSPIGIIRAAKGARGFKSLDDISITKGSYKPLTPEQRRVVSIKAAVGISFAAIIQYMVSEGLIDLSGGGPEDEKKKAQLKEQGWEPYSIKIGDKWYSYFYTPLVLTLGWMGNLNDAAKYGKEDEKTLLRRASIASLKFGGMLADMTWINSASTFLGAFVEPKIGEQQRRVENALSGMARGFVPFAQNITQLTQAYNSTFGIPAKQVNSSWEALYQDIPIARNSLNDKINALGEPVIKDIDIMWSKEKGDSIWSYLTRKQGWVASLNRKTVLIFDQDLGQDRPLTDNEFYEFSKLRGEIIKKNVQELIDNGYVVKRDGNNENVDAEDLTSSELNNILSTVIEPFATKEAKKELFGYSKKENKKQESSLAPLKKQKWSLVD